MSKPRTILIRAVVNEKQGDVLTVRLVDGFAQAQVVVHREAAIADVLYDHPAHVTP